MMFLSHSPSPSKNQEKTYKRQRQGGVCSTESQLQRSLYFGTQHLACLCEEWLEVPFKPFVASATLRAHLHPAQLPASGLTGGHLTLLQAPGLRTRQNRRENSGAWGGEAGNK